MEGEILESRSLVWKPVSQGDLDLQTEKTRDVHFTLEARLGKNARQRSWRFDARLESR